MSVDVGFYGMHPTTNVFPRVDGLIAVASPRVLGGRSSALQWRRTCFSGKRPRASRPRRST
eukprot:scaffold21597_cov108-Isochrysis_galbana.AAC.5